VHAAGITPAASTLGSHASQVLQELGSLYKGVVGAATGAGIILAAYFSFYSTAKQFLRRNTDLSDGR
jgi:solute carrier family 25 S-adenosylmethionine transporter 26